MSSDNSLIEMHPDSYKKKETLLKTHPQQSNFMFKSGIFLSSEFDSGNLGRAEESSTYNVSFCIASLYIYIYTCSIICGFHQIACRT